MPKNKSFNQQVLVVVVLAFVLGVSIGLFASMQISEGSAGWAFIASSGGNQMASPPAIAAPSCQAGWICTGASLREYVEADCTRSRIEKCDYGCSNGVCSQGGSDLEITSLWTVPNSPGHLSPLPTTNPTTPYGYSTGYPNQVILYATLKNKGNMPITLKNNPQMGYRITAPHAFYFDKDANYNIRWNAISNTGFSLSPQAVCSASSCSFQPGQEITLPLVKFYYDAAGAYSINLDLNRLDPSNAYAELSKTNNQKMIPIVVR